MSCFFLFELKVYTEFVLLPTIPIAKKEIQQTLKQFKVSYVHHKLVILVLFAFVKGKLRTISHSL